MLEHVDYEAVEAAEASLDQFINRRSASQEEANREEELWTESERRVIEKRRRENRQEWIAFYEFMHKTHLGIAAEHADRRSRLLAECGYDAPGQGPDGEGVAADEDMPGN